MLSLLNKQNKDNLKKDTGDDLLVQLAYYKTEVSRLQDDISRDESAANEIAKSKVERKLKQGASEQLALKHQSSIDLTRSKLEHRKEAIRAKIKHLENQKEILMSEINSKIEKLEASIEEEESKSNDTINYYKPLLDRCYQDVVPDVMYPASYFKKKDDLFQAKSKLSVLEMAITKLDNSTNISVLQKPEVKPIDPLVQMKINKLNTEQAIKEEQLRKRRMAEQAEIRRQQTEIEEAQREAEIRISLIKKEQVRKEEEEVRARRVNRSVVVSGYNSDYDSEGELLTKEQKRAKKKADEEDIEAVDKETMKENKERIAKGLPPKPLLSENLAVLRKSRE
jgi:hypothetical protein